MSDPSDSASSPEGSGGDPAAPYRAPTEVAGSSVATRGLKSPGCWILAILAVVVLSTIAIAMATFTVSYGGLRRGPPQNFKNQVEDFGDIRTGEPEPVEFGPTATSEEPTEGATDTAEQEIPQP